MAARASGVRFTEPSAPVRVGLKIENPFSRRVSDHVPRILPPDESKRALCFGGSLDSPERDLYGPLFALTRASRRDIAPTNHTNAEDPRPQHTPQALKPQAETVV